MNPIVQAPAKGVDAKLGVAFLEAFVEDFFHFGFAIAVGVFGVKNLRRGGDDHAVAPGDDAVGHVDAIHEEGGLVVFAVAIGVCKKFDATTGFVFAVDAVGIVGHFDNPQLAISTPIDGHGIDVSTPIDGHGIDDERLAGDLLDDVAVLDVKKVQRFLRGFGIRIAFQSCGICTRRHP